MAFYRRRYRRFRPSFRYNRFRRRYTGGRRRYRSYGFRPRFKSRGGWRGSAMRTNARRYYIGGQGSRTF